MKFSLGIKNLCAWSFHTSESQQQLRLGDTSFYWKQGPSYSAQAIPKRNQRRMSNLSKLSVDLAASLTEDQEIDHVIFSSRFGELENSKQLVEAIVDKDLLSPMAFSQSVHNTSSGLYSILKEEHCAMEAISASEDSFAMGLVSAFAFLKSNPDAKALYVFSDWEIPESYKALVDSSQHQAKAVAMILDLSMDGFPLEIESRTEIKDMEGDESMHFLDFLFRGSETEVKAPLHTKNWVYRAL